MHDPDVNPTAGPWKVCGMQLLSININYFPPNRKKLFFGLTFVSLIPHFLRILNNVEKTQNGNMDLGNSFLSRDQSFICMRKKLQDKL